MPKQGLLDQQGIFLYYLLFTIPSYKLLKTTPYENVADLITLSFSGSSDFKCLGTAHNIIFSAKCFLNQLCTDIELKYLFEICGRKKIHLRSWLSHSVIIY